MIVVYPKGLRFVAQPSRSKQVNDLCLFVFVLWFISLGGGQGNAGTQPERRARARRWTRACRDRCALVRFRRFIHL
jgi:hypothetical protein